MKINPLKFLKKYWLGILILTLLGGAGGLFFALRFPLTYEVSQTIFVKRQASAESKQFYTYDGYYSAQSAERFADSLTGFLKSREVLRFLLTEGPSAKFYSREADQILSAIKVKRVSPQLISFSYRDRRLAEAKQVVGNLIQGVLDFVGGVGRGGDEGISLLFVNPETQVVERHQNYFWSGLLGLLLGGFFSLVLFLLIDRWDRILHE